MLAGLGSELIQHTVRAPACSMPSTTWFLGQCGVQPWGSRAHHPPQGTQETAGPEGGWDSGTCR